MDKDQEKKKDHERELRKCREARKDYKALFISSTGLGRGKSTLKRLYTSVGKNADKFYLEIKEGLKSDSLDMLQIFLNRYSMTPKTLSNIIIEGLKSDDLDSVFEEKVKTKVISGVRKKVLDRERKELMENIPKSFLKYLPKTLIVELTENGEIKEIKTKFAEKINDMEAKVGRQRKLINSLDKIKEGVMRDAKEKDEDKKLSAVIIWIMMETGIRPGNLESKDLEETYGASTLEKGHIKFISGDRALLNFRGKKGTVNKAEIRDKALVGILKELGTTVRKDGSVLGQDLLTKYLRDISEEELNLTDFRKLKASEVLLKSLKDREEKLYREISKMDKIEVEMAQEEIVDKVLSMVSDAFDEAEKALNHESKNTTINSYINPQVLLNFLSNGSVSDKLEDIVLNKKKTKLEFDPKKFIEKAIMYKRK